MIKPFKMVVELSTFFNFDGILLHFIKELNLLKILFNI